MSLTVRASNADHPRPEDRNVRPRMHSPTTAPGRSPVLASQQRETAGSVQPATTTVAANNLPAGNQNRQESEDRGIFVGGSGDFSAATTTAAERNNTGDASQPNAQPRNRTFVRLLTPEEGADRGDSADSIAHRRLREIYGDHPHDNDGTHLHGNLPAHEDLQWQRWWKTLVSYPPANYSVPQGKVGRRFISILVAEFRRVRVHRTANAERIVLFTSVVLQATPSVKKAAEIRARLEQRMDLWEEGRFKALVDDTLAERLGRKQDKRALSDEEKSRRFNGKFLSGRTRQAVRQLTSRDSGGLLDPQDIDPKSNRPVIEVLRSKHPGLRVPDLDREEQTAFEAYESCPDVIPQVISAEAIERTAAKLSGGAGPSGVDAVDLRHWLLRFGSQSEGLRTELAAWTQWLCDGDPPYAAIRALMACRLVALDKQPGVRPVGIGEIYRRLMAKTVVRLTGHMATESCGNYNLCAGLASGIESAVHAVRSRYEATERKEPVDGEGANVNVPRPGSGLTSRPAAPNHPAEVAADDDPEAVLLVDARNGFNELSRFAMLWTVRHLWPTGARFAFQCYRHAAILIVRQRSQPCMTILSREGVTQGDPLSMVLYGLTLVPLAKRIRAATGDVVQPWYADDMAMAGKVSGIACATSLLQRFGPDRGYFPEPEKSILICRDADQSQAKRQLSAYHFQYTTGARYLGGFIGSPHDQAEWLKPQIDAWCFGVRALAKAAVQYPQTAYAGLCKSLQSEWLYLQRVLPECGEAFAPLEQTIRERFLPALVGEKDAPGEALRLLTRLGVKSAGLGILDPTLTAETNHASSLALTNLATDSLLSSAPLSVATHQSHARERRLALQGERHARDAAQLQQLCQQEGLRESRRLQRAKDTGIWLSVLPQTLNGTDLSRDEFRDSVRIRLGLPVLALPTTCDGCGKPFSLAHSQVCKNGGLVTMRHDDLKMEIMSLCAQAFSPGAVRDEPKINTYREPTADGPAQAQAELRGDISAHGFWTRGKTTIFDVRVTDTDAPSHSGQDPYKVLAKQERAKRDVYAAPCAERRRDFTPLVFSVDGLMGEKATEVSRRLACRLSKKWGRSYSTVCGFVRSRLSISLVRSVSMLLRAPRDGAPPRDRPTWDGSGLLLY